MVPAAGWLPTAATSVAAPTHTATSTTGESPTAWVAATAEATAATAAGGTDSATTRGAAGRASTARAAFTRKAPAREACTSSVRDDTCGGPAGGERDRGSDTRPRRATRSNVLSAKHRDIASELTRGPCNREMSTQGPALSDAQRLTSETGITLGEQEAFLRRIASHQDGWRGGAVRQGEPALPPAG